MRMNKDYVASHFDAKSAPQDLCEKMAEIIDGEKRAFSLPQALDLHKTLNDYPNMNRMKSYSA